MDPLSADRDAHGQKHPWLVVVAYTDLCSDARVIRSTKEELKSGAHVTLLVPSSVQQVAPTGLEQAEIVWLPVQQERGKTSISGHVRFFRAVSQWRRAQKCVPDVVHVHNMPDYLYWAVKPWQARGTRIVLDVHDIMSELAKHRFRGLRRILYGPILRRLELSVWRRVDHLITVHELYREKLVARGVSPARIAVVMNSPDPEIVHEQLRRPPERGRFKIVFHGTVSKRSGILNAIRAMPRVLEQVPESKMLIVGGGDGCAVVRRTIEELRLDDSIEFIDHYLPLKDVIPLIADADVGLVPNELSEFTAGMLPVKLTEYAALGIPAVATALPLVTLYFGPERAEVIERPSSDLICSALVRLARDPQRRAAVAAGARSFIRDHAWSRYAQALTTAIAS